MKKNLPEFLCFGHFLFSILFRKPMILLLIVSLNAFQIQADTVKMTKIISLSFSSEISPDTEVAGEVSSNNNSELAFSLPSSYVKNEITVRGTVTSETGDPIPGVNIIQKGTVNGTATDANGKYSIVVPEGDAVLVFSFIGYTLQEVAINGRSVIDVTLLEDVQHLEEVVVVGYGIAKKATLTGAITNIKGKELTQSPVANLSNNLAGRLPGLTVVTRSGDPGGGGSTLRIRGLNSLGNNNPLVVVDGITGRSLDWLDPNSIESISVLKDASAAIYGAQAANGVIVITTKRGEIGKPKVSMNVNYGWNQPTKIPNMTDAYEFALMTNENNRYENLPAKFSDQDLQLFKDGSDPWGHPNTNYFRETFKPWSGQNYKNLSVTGGTENVKYFFSLGSRFQDGNFKNSASNYKQTDFVSNIDSKISKYIDLSFDALGRMENRSSPARGTGSVFRALFRGNPTLPTYWPDGKPGPDIEAGDNPVVTSTDIAGYSNNKAYVFQSNIRLGLSIPGIQGLKVVSNASYDKTFNFSKSFRKPVYLYTWDGQPDHVTVPGIRGFADPRLSQSSSDFYRWTWNFLVTYEKSFLQKHTFKILTGTERQKGGTDQMSASRRNFVSDRIDQLFAGGNDIFKDNSGSASQFARINYFGRLNYDFLNKYLFEFVWRYDGSYKFAKGKQYGFFPGVSAGWRISEEDFWKNNINFIDELKIRGSWGKTGNDGIDDYQFLTTFGFGGGNYVIGNQPQALMQETKIPNPNVTWEVAKQANIGFDAQLFSGKFAISLDYFDNKRSNILIQRNSSAPAFAGLILPPENLGKVGSKGYEAILSYFGKAGVLEYSFSLNGGYSKNKVLFWDEEPNIPEYQRATGRPIPSNTSDPTSDLYYQAIGIFSDESAVQEYPHIAGAGAGDVIFEDINDDGVIDGLDRVKSSKNNIPAFSGGFTTSVRYKQFDFTALLQGATGSQTFFKYEGGRTNNYMKNDFDGRWTPDNTNATKSRASTGVTEYWLSMPSTYNIRNTDYLRVKNVELGYTISKGLIKRVGVESLRLYVNGFNLFTFDNFPELDPEMEQVGAVTGYRYFIQRVISTGLFVNF